MAKQKGGILEGPLLGKIISYSIPIMLTGILQLLFNAADLVVVGQYCGSVSVAAVGATGWVRNNFDGSVSMELQGTEAQLDAVLRAVERGSYVKIENMRVKTVPAVQNEAVFCVRDDE